MVGEWLAKVYSQVASAVTSIPDVKTTSTRVMNENMAKSCRSDGPCYWNVETWFLNHLHAVVAAASRTP